MEQFKAMSTSISDKRRYIGYYFCANSNHKAQVVKILRKKFTDLGFACSENRIIISIPLAMEADDLMNLSLGITRTIDKYILEYGE